MVRKTDSVLEELRQSAAQISGSTGVAPFVVIPRDDLDELAIVAKHLGKVSRKNAAVGIVNNVAANDRVGGEEQDALERSFSGGLDGGVDAILGRFLRQIARQVNDAARRDRNPHRDAGQFALQFRNDQTDGLGRTGARRNDVQGRGAGTIQVRVGLILNVLVVRVSVHGRHQTLLDAECLVQNLGNRCQTIGRA